MLDRVLDVIGGAPLLQRVGSRPGLITGRRDDQVQPRGGDVDASLRIRGEPWAGDPLCADDDVFVYDEADEEAVSGLLGRRRALHSTFPPPSETVASSGAQREIHAIRHFCRHGRCGPFGRGLRVVR
jgi:hypothetical protein